MSKNILLLGVVVALCSCNQSRNDHKESLPLKNDSAQMYKVPSERTYDDWGSLIKRQALEMKKMNDEPSRRLVNKQNLLEVAEEDFIAVYGEQVLRQRPFVIRETKESWRVFGTFYCRKGFVCKGGVARASYNKASGKIEGMIHGK